MGNNNSQDFIYRDNSLLSFEEDLLDYNGMNTSEHSFDEDENDVNMLYEENELNELEVDNFIEKEKKILNTYNKSNNSEVARIPVSFEWESGGNNVYLTGNFCNWNQFFLMEKNANGKHTLILNLKQGFIQYKFKVDNEWKFNEKYPTIIDNGNKNNFIDTSNWEIIAEKSEETTNSNTELSLLQNEPKVVNIEFQNAQNNYCNYIPKKNEMNELTHKAPEEYKLTKNLDKKIRQNRIGNDNYYYPEEENRLGDNYSYKKIKSVKSEQINHMNYKINSKKNEKLKEKKPIITSLVCRHRLKFTTFVYYKEESY